MVIVGCGNLGQAIANYATYYKRGFRITAMFDVNPKLIGIKINDIEVQDYEFLEKYLAENEIEIGIICTTKNSAQDVANKFTEGNVKGIWNFAPADIEVGEGIVLENSLSTASILLLTISAPGSSVRVGEFTQRNFKRK